MAGDFPCNEKEGLTRVGTRPRQATAIKSSTRLRNRVRALTCFGYCRSASNVDSRYPRHRVMGVDNGIKRVSPSSSSPTSSSTTLIIAAPSLHVNLNVDSSP